MDCASLTKVMMKVIIHSRDGFSSSLLRCSAGGKRVRPSCIGSSGAAGGGLEMRGTLEVSDWETLAGKGSEETEEKGFGT